MADTYVLVGQTPVPCELQEWAEATERGPQHVGETRMAAGLLIVSTVFLGLDHNFMRFTHPEAEPILFETAIGGFDGYDVQDRCSTWARAEAMHRHYCRHAERYWLPLVLRHLWGAWRGYWRAAWLEFPGFSDAEPVDPMRALAVAMARRITPTL
jgi:hypothetical protein